MATSFGSFFQRTGAFFRRNFSLLRLDREERWVAAVGLIVFVFFNGLLIYNHYDSFTKGSHVGFWGIFFGHLDMSGYDDFSCIALSCLRIHFSTLRHPFYMIRLFPFYWLNQWLMHLTGFNFAIFFTSLINVFCATYAAVFLFRTMRRLTCLTHGEAMLLTAMFFGFAHVLVATMVPDHFCISLFLLMLTLYYVGDKMRLGRQLTWLRAGLLFFFTAGMTLSNGVKTGIALLFANGRKAFGWRYVAVFAASVAVLGGLNVMLDRLIIQDQKRDISHIEQVQKKKNPNVGDQFKAHDEWVKQHNGQAIAKDMPLLEWSDMTTPRLRSVTDNVFGESFQLHRDHLLEDVQFSRPIFVSYRWTVSYIVEVLIVLLLVVGAWCGRREKLLLMALSWAAFDMVMHIGFGFGLNEVYIMTAHWAFIVPLSAACLLRSVSARRRLRRASVVFLSLLTLWLWAYNGSIIVDYLAAGN